VTEQTQSPLTSESDVAKMLGIEPGSGRGRRWKRRVVLILLILAVVVAALIVWGRMTQKSSAIQFITQEVRRGELAVTVTATGTLQPTNEVEVGSELSGIVKSVEVDYNDQVKVGQALARLDTSKLEAQVTQAQATLESATAKVLQTQATVKETHSKLLQFQKVRELSGGKVPSQAELDAAEAAFERAKADEASARASVSQARASLTATQTDLSKTVIRSPINGIVLSRSVEPGQTVAASLQAPVLFTLAEDLTKMELHVDVDEADVGQVKAGQEAAFSVDAYANRTFQARITQTRYGAQTVDNVVTYETVLKVDNSDLSLRPGMTATADILVQKVENAILVPNAALRFVPPASEAKQSSGGLVGMLLPRPPRRSDANRRENGGSGGKGQNVWVLKEGQPVSVRVVIGATNGTVSEVLQGDLQPGMAVAVDFVSGGR